MELKNKKNGFPIVLLIIVIGICFIVGGFLVKFRKDINNTERFASYRLREIDDFTGSSELLKQVVKENNGITIHNSTNKSHLYLEFIKLSDDDDISDLGFIILRYGNALSIYAKTSEGLDRGIYYLSHKLVDEKGMLLIKQDERVVDFGDNVYEEITIDGTDLSSYTIKDNLKAKEAINKLTYYVNQASGIDMKRSVVVRGSSIEFVIKDIDEPYYIDVLDGTVIITASDINGLCEAVDIFANTYLGWEFAGTDREKVKVRTKAKNIDTCYSTEKSWIMEREPIITLWNVNSSRGVFLNNSTSLKVDVMSFSEDQLYDYIRMMKFCGFTGIQVTDMCSAWAGAGGVEYVHERLRFMADAAHSLGMKFTLWVWGAEFTGYGWVDNSVTYSKGDYDFAHENPAVIETFEKYYSLYAELADVTDRVIVHFYDPGNLTLAEDVGFFSRKLRDKFQKINPQIDFCVDCWVDVFDKNKLIEELGNNVMFLENGYHTDETAYNGFRTFCTNNGARLGTWSWNNGEMEIDQLAAMNYKPHFIQNTYQSSIKYDEILRPVYWSEMDSYHVLNVFSLYACGKLLIAPDQNVDDITYEISKATVGEQYAERFADMLSLIEDARSGETYDTFWWSEDGYILKNDNYQAEEIKKRSENAMLLLNELIDNGIQAYSIPLPMSLTDMCRLILPNIEQIHSFAEFRIEYDKLKSEVFDISAEELEDRINELSRPVSEYNTVVGLWGQIEARAQYEMLIELAKEHEVDFEYDPTFEMERKYRIYSYFITYQKGHLEPVTLSYPYFQYGVAYGYDETVRLVKELVDEGILIMNEDGGVYLADWEHYKYSFN